MGQAFSYAIAASGTPTSFNATGLPSFLSIDPSSGVISGTPTFTGQIVVTLSATNGGGTRTGTLTITVVPPAPPVISGSSQGVFTATIGQPFNYQITATGNPMSYDATGLPSGLSISGNTISGIPTVCGQIAVGLSATNMGGTGTATLVLTIFDSSGGNANTPSFTSFPTTPDPIIAGQSVTLTAAGSDAGGSLLLYTWNFGDGTTAYGPSVTHVYTAGGVYTATVTVSNGVNSATQSVYVPVNAAAPDTSGGSGPLPNVFSVLKAAIMFNFKGYGKDSLTLSGSIPLQKNFNPSGKTAIITVGDLEQTFTLNPKGKGGNSSASLVLSGKLKNSVFTATPAKFTFTLKNQILFPLLAGLGFTDQNVPKPGKQVAVPVVASIDGVGYLAHVNVVYTAKAGASGSGKK
ncbi:MAG: PKD domain-containing protein [Planctomycetota bacterium]